MKKFRFLSLLICCMSALLVTSCLDSDDGDSGLTEAQIGQCLNVVKGSYFGDLIFAAENKDNPTDKTDTLKMTAMINAIDTTVVIYDFPVELIAKEMKDGEVKDALLNAPEQDLKSKMFFYQTSPIAFLTYPMPLEFDVFYGEKSHKVKAYFFSGQYSLGFYVPTEKELALQYVLGAVYLDDDTTTNLLKDSNNFPIFLFKSKSNL